MAAVALVLLLGACGAPATPPLVDGGPTGDPADAGSDAGSDAADAGQQDPDAGYQCPRTQAGNCVLLTWEEAPGHPYPVDHHTTFITLHSAGAHLYVTGGVHTEQANITQVHDGFHRVPLVANGRLGQWEALPALPRPLAFHAQVQTDSRVYLIGGVSSDAQGVFASTAVFVAELPPDGSPPTWNATTPLAEACVHSTAELIGSRLFVIGGLAGAPKTAVLVSTLGIDGAPGPWSHAAPLPENRTHHASVVIDGRIYVLGGYGAGSVSRSDILRSVHDQDGALTDWETVGLLPDAPWTPTVVHRGEFLYLLGGGKNFTPPAVHNTAEVRRARLGETGDLGEWEGVDEPMLMPRSHVHQTPVFNGRIYSVGGRTGSDFSSSDRAFIGTFLPGS